MTDKERKDYVLGTYLKCTKPITNIRKGKTGCKVGESYWFEYVHDTGDDNEYPDAESYYRKLSDNHYNDEVYITDDELINNFEKVIDGRDVVVAMGIITNGEYVAKNYSTTMMYSGDEYDEKGRKVSADPNYKSGRINVCGKTYPLVRKGWDVYIWKPEYQDATYTWTWKKDCDKYLFAKISLMPDYVRIYEERKENEIFERNKKFVKEGRLVCNFYNRYCEDPKDDTVISLIEYEGRFAIIELQWLYEEELKNGLKVRGSFPAEQTWENIKGFRYIYEEDLKCMVENINELLEKKQCKN